jgi:hypothetical protein
MSKSAATRCIAEEPIKLPLIRRARFRSAQRSDRIGSIKIRVSLVTICDFAPARGT